MKIHFLLILLMLAAGILPPSGAKAITPPEIEAKLERGQRLFESGSLLEAIADLEIVCKEQPENQEARGLLVSAYRFLGIEFYLQSQCEEALAAWRKVLNIQPSNVEILGFIDRCESEMQSIARIQGDTTALPTNNPASDTTKSAQITLPPPKIITKVVHDTVRIETMVPQPPRQTIGGGLAFGPVFKAGGSFPDQDAGLGMIGHVSLAPKRPWPGLRFEGLFARLQREINAPTESAMMERAAIFGGSAGVFIRSHLSTTSTFVLHAGIGAYEVFLTGRTGEAESSFSNNSMKAGLPIGGFWHHRIGDNYALTLDAQVVFIGGSSSPDIVLLTLGLSAL